VLGENSQTVTPFERGTCGETASSKSGGGKKSKNRKRKRTLTTNHGKGTQRENKNKKPSLEVTEKNAKDEKAGRRLLNGTHHGQ